MSNPLDILFVKPGNQKRLYGELSDFQLTAIEPPLWAALLAADMRGRGYAVDILDAEVEELDSAEVAKKVSDARPRVCVVTASGTNPSASTMNMTGLSQMLNRLKELAPEVRTAVTGLHPSALPEQTLRDESVDYVCQGEGFVTLPALVDAIKSSRTISDVPGLWFRDGDQIKRGPEAAVCQNLDALPMPAWDLLPIERYRAHNWHCFDHIDRREPYGVIYTSLGCPFKCSFCCINALFGKPGIRYRAPKLVVDEIDYLVRERGVKNIKIIDEMFVLNKQHVTELCERIIERGYDLNMWAYARVNTVTPDLLSLMKKAGINWVAYGFESGSERVLRSVSKGYKVDKTMDAVRMTYDAGLYICANFIFGLPEDDMESMQETLAMAQEINAEWANLYSTMAYPGSELHRQAVEEGWPLPETYSGYSQYSYDCLPLPTKYLTSGEVLAFRDEAFHRYHESPRYLEMITRHFGSATTDHIRGMTSKRLERKWITR